MLINPCKCANGEIQVPGDKSISHRAVMLGSIAVGLTEIKNFLFSQDCLNTINCFKKLGTQIEYCKDNTVKIYGKGLHLNPPCEVLYVGNSGTTIRLLTGILVGQKFNTTIDGDSSIQKRPMDRIIEPLTQMGSKISGIDNNYAPLIISSTKLNGIKYFLQISSAQVKSCILLASLYASDKTIFHEPFLSRNHTELMLDYFGGNIKINGVEIINEPVAKLNGQKIIIPGDISSASFFIVLGLLLPNSQITVKNVGLNPTRTGIIDILKLMGGRIIIENIHNVNNELVGDITSYTSTLKGVLIEKGLIPRIIDELPIIAVAATQAAGTTLVKDASELKIKESNRIKSLVTELSKMNANIIETDDGFIIDGPTNLYGARLNGYCDHRMVMALTIASKIANSSSSINNESYVNTSFPGFFEILESICNQ